ncbi:2-hydroxyacid dehydrogenase [Denitrobaculum tricleocarpae]|uniref:D-glycerate dehydrogenase n=1 Tax=Denitrobaculum tricleocarpae TaxID=2591009 RepID=A0A545TEX0_9PROT|nr:D-glycerate dehydrogenase [Denitrobaculum tricleocarpae]TQV75777.1 D-glycerate dehydrogenase [Denitrobaculum tricleocarpae]
MIKPKVVITRRWPKAVEAALVEDFDVTFNKQDRALTADELKDAVHFADAVLPTVTDRIDARVLDDANPRTKILANYGVGYSHIDIDSARTHGITVTNTPDVLSECTADLTLTLMLMAARRASEGEREVKTGAWSGWRPTHLLGSKVSGKTLGIIGFGRIGQEVAKRAHHGFGMRVLAFNRSPIAQDVLIKTGAESVASIDELLPQADFVSLHCPGGAANKHLIDCRRLGLMRESAFLINTARGEVVDERALVQALTFETIAGAGLDVFNGEPDVLPELRSCENAVLLPHLGSATLETREAMGFRVVQNLKDFFEGRAPRDLVA